eukprot:m.8051 g.8051  ORF g.8051 m.8051 type:complete len:313 (+) comp5003_c0_seq1:1526-2464(+)
MSGKVVHANIDPSRPQLRADPRVFPAADSASLSDAAVDTAQDAQALADQDNNYGLIDHNAGRKGRGGGAAGAVPPPAAAPVPLDTQSSDVDPDDVGGNRNYEGTGDLICEGYLNKNRGFGTVKKRFFRLSTTEFAYFTKEAGEIINKIDAKHMQVMTDLNKGKFRVFFDKGFGGSGSREMLLEAPNTQIKLRWLEAYQKMWDKRDTVLLAEGYLTKVQSSGGSNTTRWFVLTNRDFSYYKEEAGERMATVRLENVLSVNIKDQKEFQVQANVAFTKTGANEVLIRCEHISIRNRWLTAFRAVLPDDRVMAPF